MVPDAKGFISVVFRTPLEELTFMHPTLQLLNQAWEMSEPMVYMPRLGLRPLPDHPIRPIYQPVAPGDSYFPTTIYDAAALAYGNRQAGEAQWDSMQAALELDDRAGFESYPVEGNLTSESGDSYTGAVVQYQGLPDIDPHSIYVQLDEVKYQYGCFFETLLATLGPESWKDFSDPLPAWG